MKLAPVPFPPDIQYVLDGALDNDEITPFTHAALALFGDRRRVMDIVDRDEPGRRGWRWGRGQKFLDLDAHAHEAIADMPIDVKRALFATALIREPIKIKSDAECMASWRFEDAVQGGALQPFLNRRRCNDNYEPTRGLSRHLAAPAAIRRYVRNSDEIIPFHRVLRGRLRMLPWPSSLAEAETLKSWFEQQRERYSEAQQRAFSQMMDRIGGRAYQRLGPPKADRQRIRKSFAIAEATIGRENAVSFLRGEKVTIVDNDLVFEVRKNGGLLTLGHGGMHIAISRVGIGHLGNLCLYFDQTPTLDQVAALALHIQAGETATLIKTGNFYNVTASGAADPLVSAQLIERKQDARQAPTRHDRLRSAAERHFTEFGHHYIEALRVGLWGRDARRLQAICAGI